MVSRLMIYKRPVVQRWGTLDVFFNRLLPRTVDGPADMDWRAKRLKEFIDNHPGSCRWNLDDICKQLGLPTSGRQARRLFKVSTGMGIREYAKNIRLASAAQQLQVTNVLIKVIAADLGYQSTCHFARSFKEVFRLSPLEFRRVWRQRAFAA